MEAADFSYRFRCSEHVSVADSDVHRRALHRCVPSHSWSWNLHRVPRPSRHLSRLRYLFYYDHDDTVRVVGSGSDRPAD